MRQQADQRDVGRAGRRILRNAEQRREHARLDFDALFLDRDVKMDADRPFHRQVLGQRLGPDGCPGEGGARRYLGEHEARAARGDDGPMVARLDQLGREAANLRHDLGRDFIAELQRLRRRQPGRHDRSNLARDVERDQAGLLLEHQPIAREGPAVTLPGARQHEGRADIGMAGERQLGLGREDADLGGMRGIPGRQHEGRLGEVEFGRDRLHLLRRQALGVGDDGQRIAAERPVGEHVDGGEFEFHGADPSGWAGRAAREIN